MHELLLKPGWDTFLYVVPAFCILLAYVFRLDELFIKTGRRPSKRHPAWRVDKNGRMVLCDPDGRPFYPRRPVR